MKRVFRVLLIALASLNLAVSGAEAKSKRPSSCKSSLAVCPMEGCERNGTPHALMNQLKRTLPKTEAGPILLELDDFDALQKAADDVLDKSQKVDLPAAERKQLQGISLPSGGTVGEGAFVEVRAFIVGLPNHPAANTSGESVNCRLKGEKNNDF